MGFGDLRETERRTAAGQIKFGDTWYNKSSYAPQSKYTQAGTSAPQPMVYKPSTPTLPNLNTSKLSQQSAPASGGMGDFRTTTGEGQGSPYTGMSGDSTIRVGGGYQDGGIEQKAEQRGSGPAGDMTQTQAQLYQSLLDPNQQNYQPNAIIEKKQIAYDVTKDPAFIAMQQGYQAMQQEYQALYNSNIGLAAQISNNELAALESAKSEILKMFQDQIGGIDPATQQALASLEQSVKQRGQQIMEELNRRGIAQSGITIEEFGKLAGTANERETMIRAQRVQDLQNQMISSLLQFAQSRLSALSGYGKNQMNAFSSYADSTKTALQNTMSQYATRQLAAEKAGREQELAQYNQGEQNYRAQLPYIAGPTPYQQQQLQQQQNRLPSIKGPTQTETTNYWIASAIKEMNRFSSLQERNDWLFNHKAEIIQDAGPGAYQYLLEQLYPSYK